MEKRYIHYLILSLILVILSVGALNYIVDPLLYYQRDKRAFQILYTENQRELIPGLIKNSPDHNAVIIGSSMAGNFIASEVSRTLNEKTLKLSIDGATLFEQHYVLSKYLDTHPEAKTVIWGLDTSYVSEPATITTRKNYIYPFFLYGDTKINFKYLLNYDVTVHSFQTIANNLFGMRFFMKTRDINKIHTWDTPTGCNQVIEHYKLISAEHMNDILKTFDVNNAEKNIGDIAALAKKNTDVQFFIFLPPYSIVRYYISYENGALDVLLKARNFVAKRLEGISHVKIIDLQASSDIINNLDYYKDMGHFNRTVNNIILKHIADSNFTGYETIVGNTQKLYSIVSTLDFEKVVKCEKYE